MENLFTKEGYSPGQELDRLFEIALPKLKKLEFGFYGKHTSEILKTLSSYVKLTETCCFKPTPTGIGVETEVFTKECAEYVEIINLTLAKEFLNLISAVYHSTGLTPASYSSAIEEDMNSKNLQASYFYGYTMKSALSLSRFMLMYQFGLGNYKFQSIDIKKRLPNFKFLCMGTIVSPTMSESLERIVLTYLHELSKLVSFSEAQLKEDNVANYLRICASNTLTYYFVILEFLGVDQNELLTLIINANEIKTN